jgi:hypothetical protein
MGCHRDCAKLSSPSVRSFQALLVALFRERRGSCFYKNKFIPANIQILTTPIIYFVNLLFVYFIHRLGVIKTTTFQKSVLLPSSGERRTKAP